MIINKELPNKTISDILNVGEFDFDTDKIIGEGFFSCVYKYNEQCVLKTVIDDTTNYNLEYEYIKELNKAGIPHIPKFMAYDSENNYLFIEYIDGNNLNYLIKNNLVDRKLLKKIIHAILDLFEKNIYIYDLHDENIVVDKYGNIFFIDLGNVKFETNVFYLPPILEEPKLYDLNINKLFNKVLKDRKLSDLKIIDVIA